MCTGGGSVLKIVWLGSRTLTLSVDKNHNLPSEDLATLGLRPLGKATVPTPSERSNTIAWIVRFASVSVSAPVVSSAAAHASSSERARRTRPQAMYSQT